MCVLSAVLALVPVAATFASEEVVATFSLEQGERVGAPVVVAREDRVLLNSGREVFGVSQRCGDDRVRVDNDDGRLTLSPALVYGRDMRRIEVRQAGEHAAEAVLISTLDAPVGSGYGRSSGPPGSSTSSEGQVGECTATIIGRPEAPAASHPTKSVASKDDGDPWGGSDRELRQMQRQIRHLEAEVKDAREGRRTPYDATWHPSPEMMAWMLGNPDLRRFAWIQ
jgi:hypothetical protein